MQQLPPALQGLSRFAQFVPYRLVPSERKPGKTDKLPVNWRTGRLASVTDASAWTTFENAASVGADGVGFVFTDADPFFFVDIDGALAEGKWSELADTLCSAFAGAAVEVSSSGKGLHIIGTGTAPLGHRCRNKANGLEFYTTERFVALTGAQAYGNVDTECSHLTPWLLEHFFPAGSEQVDRDDWTSEPRSDWRGPTDDAELLRRAMNSKSAASVFGTKATFADLYTRNVEVLARAYPETEGNAREFAESEADAALASHLAFWTGANCERVRELMLSSALVRDKWEDLRPGGTWLDLTIRRMCNGAKDVCQDKERPAPAPSPAITLGSDGVELARAETRQGDTYLRADQQRELFAGCVYVLEAHRVLLPGGQLVKPEQFRSRFGGHSFVLDANNEKITRNAWEAFTESSVNACPMADATWFRPVEAPGVVTNYEGRRYVNTYWPAATLRAEGDSSRILAHLEKLLPFERDRQIILAYMAAVVQYPGVKFQWAPLLQGVEGNGKTLFSRCVAYAVGERYTHWPRADQIAKNFNAWLVAKLFIAVEDMYLPEDRGEVWEILKPMITSDRQPVEPKGVDQTSLWVYCNFMLNSNHQDAIKKSRNDRRIAPFFTAQQTAEDVEAAGMGGNYFPDLYDWCKGRGAYAGQPPGYAQFAHFLATYPIPHEFNPATGCQRAPTTTSTEAAIRVSVGTVEQEIAEAIASGQPGFLGGWISSTQLTKLLERIGKSRSMPLRKREQMLAELGYVKHPGLPAGRCNNVVLPDASKPVLYVTRERADVLAISKGSEVERAYSLAQGCALG